VLNSSLEIAPYNSKINPIALGIAWPIEAVLVVLLNLSYLK
jgi:hypothetical protein